MPLIKGRLNIQTAFLYVLFFLQPNAAFDMVGKWELVEQGGAFDGMGLTERVEIGA